MFNPTIRSAAIAVAAAACLLAPASAHAQKRQRDIITRDEIQASAQKELDLYEVVRALRPHFLEKPRGVRTIRGAMPVTSVYVDGVKETDLDALKHISALNIDEVRYLEPSKAENEYGAVAAGGAVVVKTYKGPATPPPARDTTKPPTG